MDHGYLQTFLDVADLRSPRGGTEVAEHKTEPYVVFIRRQG